MPIFSYCVEDQLVKNLLPTLVAILVLDPEARLVIDTKDVGLYNEHLIGTAEISYQAEKEVLFHRLSIQSL
jgi:hypothetical protein